jgi:transposase
MCFLFTSIGILSFHLNSRVRQIGGASQRWRDLFGAKCDLLLYDLTSTYFEGQAGEIPAARRGYSRDSRPDALQLILAMVVTEEGLPAFLRGL